MILFIFFTFKCWPLSLQYTFTTNPSLFSSNLTPFHKQFKYHLIMEYSWFLPLVPCVIPVISTFVQVIIINYVVAIILNKQQIVIC